MQFVTIKLSTVEPLNNGHIGGRDFVPCREVVHYRRSIIFLLIISTFQWLNESMRVRGIFEHFACVCTKINISFIILKSTGTQQVSLDLTKIALPYEGGLLPSHYWHSEENKFSFN